MSVDQLRQCLGVVPSGAGGWRDVPLSHRATDASAFFAWSLAAAAFGAVSLLPAAGFVALAAARSTCACPMRCAAS